MLKRIRHKVSKKTLALFIALLIFIPISIYVETTFPYGQVSVQPIKVYYPTTQKILLGNESMGILVYGYPYPNWTINNLEMTIENGFSDSTGRFMLDYTNLSRNMIGWHPISESQGTINITEIHNYVKNNLPDMLITYPIIKNGDYYFYRDVIELPDGTNLKTFDCGAFLTRTAYDTWEGEILLDGSRITIERENRTFASVTVDKLSVQMPIPNNYQIQNPESMNIAQSSDVITVAKSLFEGETFHLIVKDLNLVPIKALMDWMSGIGILGLIAGLLISRWYDTKPKRGRPKGSVKKKA